MDFAARNILYGERSLNVDTLRSHYHRHLFLFLFLFLINDILPVSLPEPLMNRR